MHNALHEILSLKYYEISFYDKIVLRTITTQSMNAYVINNFPMSYRIMITDSRIYDCEKLMYIGVFEIIEKPAHAFFNVCCAFAEVFFH